MDTSISRQVEAALIAAMERRVPDAHVVCGREAARMDRVKTYEDVDRAQVVVAVGQPSSEGFGTPEVGMSATVTVRHFWAYDPDLPVSGEVYAAFDAAAAAVSRTLLEWNLQGNLEDAANELSTEGFRCDGIRPGGGVGYEPTAETPYVSTEFEIVLKGVFRGIARQ